MLYLAAFQYLKGLAPRELQRDFSQGPAATGREAMPVS